MYRDESLDPPAIVCRSARLLRYDLRAIEDLRAMLKAHGDGCRSAVPTSEEAAEGTVEAWGRSAANPIGGWYGLKKGLRGRFGMYMPPLLEALGLAEVEAQPAEQSDAGALGHAPATHHLLHAGYVRDDGVARASASSSMARR
jgi:hypothetical protein